MMNQTWFPSAEVTPGGGKGRYAALGPSSGGTAGWQPRVSFRSEWAAVSMACVLLLTVMCLDSSNSDFLSRTFHQPHQIFLRTLWFPLVNLLHIQSCLFLGGPEPIYLRLYLSFGSFSYLRNANNLNFKRPHSFLNIFSSPSCQASLSGHLFLYVEIILAFLHSLNLFSTIHPVYVSCSRGGVSPSLQ